MIGLPLTLPCIIVQVVGKTCAMYRLLCKSGVLNKCYSACDLEFFEGNVCLSVKGWQSSARVSIREASKESTPYGVHFQTIGASAQVHSMLQYSKVPLQEETD